MKILRSFFFVAIAVMLSGVLAMTSCKSEKDEPEPVVPTVPEDTVPAMIDLRIALIDETGNDLLSDNPDMSLYYAPVSASYSGGVYPMYWEESKARLYADPYLASDLMNLPAAEDAEVPFHGLVRRKIDGRNYLCLGYFSADSVFERKIELNFGFNERKVGIVFRNQRDEVSGDMAASVKLDGSAEQPGNVVTITALRPDYEGYDGFKLWDFEPFGVKIDIVNSEGRSLLLKNDTGSVYGDSISLTFSDGTIPLKWNNVTAGYEESFDYDVPGRSGRTVYFYGLKYMWSTFHNGVRQQYTGHALLKLGDINTQVPMTHDFTVNWDNGKRHDRIKVVVGERKMSSKNTPLPYVTVYHNDKLFTGEVIQLVK